MKQENIIRVQFREPPYPNKPRQLDFFFGSLAAIYEQFTPEQVGCRVEHLWNYGIMADRPYMNKQVVISRETLSRKAQNAASRKRKKDGQ